MPLAPSEFSVNWVSPPLEAEAWERLQQLPEEANRDADRVYLGPIVTDAQVAALSIVREGGGLDWHCHLYRRPAADPPPEIVRETERLGGAAGLRRQIALSWSEGAPPRASYRLTAQLPQGEWECPTLPSVPVTSDPIRHLDPTAAVEQIGYRLLDGPIGLQEVTIVYLHKEATYMVRCEATGVVAVQENLVWPYPTDVLNLVAGTFFRQRHG